MEWLPDRWNGLIAIGTPKVKTVHWAHPDTEVRKDRERIGLETQVVYPVNDAYHFYGWSMGSQQKIYQDTGMYSSSKRALLYDGGDLMKVFIEGIYFLLIDLKDNLQ